MCCHWNFIVCQVLTYFISIGQNVGKNLHKLVNQRTLGVLADTLTTKLTLRVSKKILIGKVLYTTNYQKKAANLKQIYKLRLKHRMGSLCSFSSTTKPCTTITTGYQASKAKSLAFCRFHRPSVLCSMLGKIHLSIVHIHAWNNYLVINLGISKATCNIERIDQFWCLAFDRNDY